MAVADEFNQDDEGKRSGLGRFFGVAFDPRTYGALLYMVLALATGIFYFTWVVTGLSLSVSLMILIIGVPLALLFLGSVRVLSYMEGFLAQGLLGAQLRDEDAPVLEREEITLWTRIKAMLSDVRTWTSMIYMILQLGLGVLYFTVAITGLAVSLSFIAAPILQLLDPGSVMVMDAHSLGHLSETMPWLASAAESGVAAWLLLPLGIFLLFVTMHIARGVGTLHRHIAEALLVKR